MRDEIKQFIRNQKQAVSLLSEQQKAGANLVLTNLEALLTEESTQELVVTKNGRYMRIAEAVEVLGVHDNTIRRWIKSGQVPSKKLGGSVFVWMDSALTG